MNLKNLRIGTNTGGGGSHWAAQCHRYLPYDYEIFSQTVERYGEEKILEGMTIQDWGITYNQIEPYYDKFEKMAGISGEQDPMGPERSSPFPTPPMKEVPATRLFKEAAKNLGYHPISLPSASISETYENPDGQTIYGCQYCSFCYSHGCEFGAKSDPVITVIPRPKKLPEIGKAAGQTLREFKTSTNNLIDDNDETDNRVDDKEKMGN